MSPMHAVRRAGTFLFALGLVVLSASPADAETATDGTRTLTVSQATGLDPAGQMVRVTGSGYDTFKGIYVAFCAVPASGQAPSPCGGGVDMAGGSGASHWISSNPPPYGQGVATPYGPGGSFDVTVANFWTATPTWRPAWRSFLATRMSWDSSSGRSGRYSTAAKARRSVATRGRPARRAARPRRNWGRRWGIMSCWGRSAPAAWGWCTGPARRA